MHRLPHSPFLYFARMSFIGVKLAVSHNWRGVVYRCYGCGGVGLVVWWGIGVDEGIGVCGGRWVGVWMRQGARFLNWSSQGR